MANQLLVKMYGFVRKSLFRLVSVGPLPNHIAFIMDGNRRYARRKSMSERDGYRIGFFSLMSILKYCHELGIKHISLYAFSIDNFSRRPEEVQFLMDLMQEKIEGLLEDGSFAKRFGVRVNFVGNLKLLSDKLRETAQKAMDATAKNTQMVLHVCVAYAATDEIVHAVKESCHEKWEKGAKPEIIVNVRDIENKMYMSVAPEPNLLIRTSGETRLSNFILWQTQSCLLYSPVALWPELGLRHLVWAVLNFQREYYYLEKIRQRSPEKQDIKEVSFAN